MVEFKNESQNGRYPINGCKPQEVLINHKPYHQSLIVSAQTLIEDWRPRTIQELIATDWEPVIALEPRIVLLGTGPLLRFPPTQILAPLIESNIGFEIMDTSAACRTYTILMAEDRHVVAALILR